MEVVWLNVLRSSINLAALEAVKTLHELISFSISLFKPVSLKNVLCFCFMRKWVYFLCGLSASLNDG